MASLRIGIIGIGNISTIYFDNLKLYSGVEVVAVADIDSARGKAAAEKYNVGLVLSPDDLIAHPDVDLVLNLTIPAAHGPVASQAVNAGKHVYNEKPLTTDFDTAKALIAAAAAAGVRVGCAPDTFLGSGIQTAREAIDRGDIGVPVAIQGSMMGRGPEPWHPNPEFFYKPGGGPMLDMGPYYLTAFVNLLGPFKRSSGFARISYDERAIPRTNEGFYGRPDAPAEGEYLIKVETATHLAASYEFASGPIGQLTTSFDVYGDWSNHPITVFGSEGTLKVPDPNNFDGDVLLKRGGGDFETVTPRPDFRFNARGVGLLDIAVAVQSGRAHRASGDLALHVLEAMLSIQKATDSGTYYQFETTVERPASLAPGELPDAIREAAATA